MMCFGVKDRKPARTNHCVIVLLDDTQLVHELHTNSTGQDLLDVVIKHLNLLETSYFGLKYLEALPNNAQYSRNNPRQQQVCWLDVNKNAIKQLRNVQPMTVYFGVKYYASDPCKLAEEITRYQFFLQCKQDILHGRLQVNFELAVELFALAVQSELGDYDPQRHLDGYVSEFQFSANQTHELEKRVAIYHRSLCGQVPATAELNFLERVKWLDLYGAQLFPIQYDEDDGRGSYEDYSLGLNPSGVLVLRNNARVAHYLWPRIIKTKCQGRCFLMDVIQPPTSNQQSGKPERNRFGFRLADKDAAQRLAWAIDEHKSFHQLVHSSVQRGQQQQQSMKLSQRFRNSIRSAMNVAGGVPLGSSAAMQISQQQQQQQQQFQQHLQLRSSIKSMQANLERQPPTVVRMPSRRYGNSRSSLGVTGSRPTTNNNPGMAHTMVESQRQQAILMMNQLNQMNAMVGKSQTLKPSSRSNGYQANELKRNPYYQQLMLMLAASSQQNASDQNQQQPDISILPPGRHVVQPAIYKATSVINGINQLAPGAKPAQLAGPAMLQFFNTPQSSRSFQTGHESPKSTKSAIAPSSALKLASKKLAKQHQLAMYNNRNLVADAQPLLAFDHNQRQYPQQYPNYYGYVSANQSPRSIRSARMRHRSKSTSENLNLLHQHQQQQQMAQAAAALLAASNNAGQQQDKSRMLLATTQQMLNQNLMPPPPPDYNTSGKHSSRPSQNNHDLQSCKIRSNAFGTGKTDQALLLNTNGLVQKTHRKFSGCNKPAVGYSDDDDDYCCSRSDCSSVNNEHLVGGQQRFQAPVKSTKAPPEVAGDMGQGQQEDWNAIRKRHSEFSSGKGNFSNLLSSQFIPPAASANRIVRSKESDARRQPIHSPEQDIEEQLVDSNNNNNNSNNCQQLVKNIANKQATPILLSMNQFEGGTGSCNNKAVQLLNLQRQQLNHSNSGSSAPDSPDANSGVGSNKSSSSAPLDSAASSMASSPQMTSQGAGARQQSSSASSGSSTTSQGGNKTSDSTSSNTSGYYAASNNSTGSASLDSDGHPPAETKTNRRMNVARRTGHFEDWPEEGTRSKIALSSYAGRLSGNRLVIGNKAALNNQTESAAARNASQTGKGKQQQFYLGEPNNEPVSNGAEQIQWSQASNSSLKYVSFDV